MKKRFTDEQIVGFFREVEGGDKSVAQACRDGWLSPPTFYGWRRRLGSLNEPEVKRLLAERDLELDMVREYLKKVTGARGRRSAAHDDQTHAGGPPAA